MDDQKQITEEEFLANQQFESLARQNAQQAVRIAQLESQLALIQAKAQQAQQAQQPTAETSTQEISDEDYEEPSADPTH